MFPLVWQGRHGNCMAAVTSEAMKTMLEHQQVTSSATEAGGVLAGYRRGPHLEIVAVSTPGRQDGRSRTRFDRRDPKHKKFIRDLWKSSKGKVDYLGEWHTHPERIPYPSGLDFSQAREISGKFPRAPILELVVGTEGMWLGTVSPTSIDEFSALRDAGLPAPSAIILPDSIGSPHEEMARSDSGSRFMQWIRSLGKVPD